MQPTKQHEVKQNGNKGKPVETQQAKQPQKPAQAPVFGEPVDESELPKPTVELSKAEKRALFDKVLGCMADIDTADEAVKAAKARNSAAVRELVAKAGSGPWKVGGVLYKARLYGKDGNDYACLVKPNDMAVEEL